MSVRNRNGPLLSVGNVRLAFLGREALRDVSLTAFPREILVLLGPNGAGKSTLIRTICGRLQPDAGRVSVGGRDPSKSAEARATIGLVPQQIALFERLTAHENLVTFGRLMGLARRTSRDRASTLLERVGLADRAADLVSTLSGGMRRRINIAAGLLHEPQLLILDEPTAGLDASSKQDLVTLLRSLKTDGLSILLTTHDMEEADALADRVAILIAGEIRAIGSVAALIAQKFGTAKEIQLTLASQAVADPRMSTAVQRLRDAHLQPSDGGRVWTGFVEGGPESINELLGQAGGVGGVVEQVGVRQPGLHSLMQFELAHYGSETP